MKVEWCSHPTGAVEQAINLFKLQAIGWRGFEEFDWVKQILTRYPLANEIALKCSAISGNMLEELALLMNQATPEDRFSIRSFFVCKLALEELSCRRNGAGAGMCDKRAAFMDIFRDLAKRC